MCLMFAACGSACKNAFDSVVGSVTKIKSQRRDEELTRLQNRKKGSAADDGSSGKTRIRQSPNDFSVKDTLSTLKFWQ